MENNINELQSKVEQLEKELSETHMKFSIERMEYANIIANLIGGKSQDKFELDIFRQNASIQPNMKYQDTALGGTSDEN